MHTRSYGAFSHRESHTHPHSCSFSTLLTFSTHLLTLFCTSPSALYCWHWNHIYSLGKPSCTHTCRHTERHSPLPYHILSLVKDEERCCAVFPCHFCLSLQWTIIVIYYLLLIIVGKLICHLVYKMSKIMRQWQLQNSIVQDDVLILSILSNRPETITDTFCPINGHNPTLMK